MSLPPLSLLFWAILDTGLEPGVTSSREFSWMFFLFVLIAPESCLYHSVSVHRLILFFSCLSFSLHLGALRRQRPLLICLCVIIMLQNIWYIYIINIKKMPSAQQMFCSWLNSRLNSTRSVRNCIRLRERTSLQQNHSGLDSWVFSFDICGELLWQPHNVQM